MKLPVLFQFTLLAKVTTALSFPRMTCGALAAPCPGCDHVALTAIWSSFRRCVASLMSVVILAASRVPATVCIRPFYYRTDIPGALNICREFTEVSVRHQTSSSTAVCPRRINLHLCTLSLEPYRGPAVRGILTALPLLARLSHQKLSGATSSIDDSSLTIM